MAISTNSVIHYTNNIDNLTGIIAKQGFRLKYCYEDLDIKLDIILDSALPMVSFCDIPLSEIKNHIDTYGSYGIGLSKIWAKKNGLNPVLYLEKQSNITRNLKAQLERIFELRKNNKIDKILENEFVNILSYCKNYERKLVRGKFDSESYRFYDEREWRYIACEDDLNGESRIILGKIYSENKNKFNKKIENCYLKFNYNDISYIIVDSENEIPEILSLLTTTYEDKCTAKELKILSTKIITKDQIYNDF